MRSDKEELVMKDQQVAALKRQLAIKDRRISELQKELSTMEYRAKRAEEQLAPVKESLDSMTAERSKWIRKMRKAGLDV